MKEGGVVPKWFMGATVVVCAFLLGFLAITELLLPRVVGFGEEVMVPDVTGMTTEDAVRRLVGVQLEGEIRHEEPDPDAPVGTVLEQDPLPGQVVKAGRKVGLTLSSGAESAIVPEMVGRSLRQARIDVASAGLNVDEVVRTGDNEVAAEHVVASNPSEGTRLPLGGSIQLLVSTGAAPLSYVMPDLTGRDFSQVREDLESRGFRVERARYTGGSAGVERVLDQEPAAGSRIAEGARVALTVGGD